MTDFTREDLLERLNRLDEDADLLLDSDDDRRFRLVIAGGSALILLETITRATHDIDALDVSPEIVSLLRKYDINTHTTRKAKAPQNSRLEKVEGRILSHCLLCRLAIKKNPTTLMIPNIHHFQSKI